MARKTGGGSFLVFLLVIGWVVSKCGGHADTSTPASSSLPPAITAAPVQPTETMYVNAATLNQRSAPNGSVVGKTARGDSVTIYERSGNWARVSPDNSQPLWVSGSHLCSGSSCYVSKLPNRAATPTRRSRPNYIDGTCPCSGNRVCIGPRGGRYCITSSGSKRYGV